MENGLLGWEERIKLNCSLRRLLVTVVEMERSRQIWGYLEMTSIVLANGLDVVREGGVRTTSPAGWMVESLTEMQEFWRSRFGCSWWGQVYNNSISRTLHLKCLGGRSMEVSDWQLHALSLNRKVKSGGKNLEVMDLVVRDWDYLIRKWRKREEGREGEGETGRLGSSPWVTGQPEGNHEGRSYKGTWGGWWCLEKDGVKGSHGQLWWCCWETERTEIIEVNRKGVSWNSSVNIKLWESENPNFNTQDIVKARCL